MTNNVFDEIAPGWYNFRHWTIFRKELEDLAIKWSEGKLLNIGCAHGPDFLPFTQNFELHGIDSSYEMLKYALKYSSKFNFTVQLAQADARYLPYTDQTFDFVIAVATYHHIRYKVERLKALFELRRILKSNGEAFITVWNGWQPRFLFKNKEQTVPWRKQGRNLYRYYYLFNYPEFEGLVKQAGFRILKSFPESSYRFPIKLFSRNICLLIQKN